MDVAHPESPVVEPALTSRAREVHDRAVVVNGLVGSSSVPADVAGAAELARVMRAGGVTAVNLTIALDAGFAQTIPTFMRALRAIEQTEGIRVALTGRDIADAKAQAEAAIIFGFQNADPIENRLEYLQAFHRLGLRILQLTYQRRNLLADGCGEEADAGLSIFGRSVIEECNRLGILIDLSHVGYRATMEAIDASAAPVSFTHVDLQRFNPVPRNKTDEQVRALAQRGGVVGFNAVARLVSPHGRVRGATVDELLEQIDHAVELVGVDHVGLGLDINEGMTEDDFMRRRETFLTDYPELKMGGDFPFEYYYVTGLNTMANMGLITDGLLARGYADDHVLKILGGNLLRLCTAIWGS